MGVTITSKLPRLPRLSLSVCRSCALLNASDTSNRNVNVVRSIATIVDLKEEKKNICMENQMPLKTKYHIFLGIEIHLYRMLFI
jgi:recombinational DNA repair protein RecR